MSTELALGNGQTGFCMSFAHAVIHHVGRQGGDAALVMQAMGCCPSLLQCGGERRIAARQLAAGLMVASRCLGDEHAGLRIGMGMTPSHLGALGYAAMTAPNGISALRLYEELQRLFMTELNMRHEVRGPLIWSHTDVIGNLPKDYQFWACMAACRLNFIRSACGRSVVPERLDLPCPPPSCQQALRDLIGAPVNFHVPAYGEWFPAAALHEPNPQGSPEIHRVMATMAGVKWRESCDPDEWVFSRLKDAILQALEKGDNPTLKALAPRLSRIDREQGAITARQLQRKLSAHCRSFRSVVSEVRKERALAQLRSTNRPLADIAAEAGYAELSSFHRAVRRWTGLTPMRIRKEGTGRDLDLV